MLATLLPGLREVRTPLAVGYLWLVFLWLLLHKWIPTTVDQAPAGPVRFIYELGSLLGSAVALAALSFVAYLLGAILTWQPVAGFGRIIDPPWVHDLPRYHNALPHWVTKFLFPIWAWRFIFNYRGQRSYLYHQLQTLMGGYLVQSDNLKDHEHNRILTEVSFAPSMQDFSEGGGMRLFNLQRAYVRHIANHLEPVAIQLQAKNRDFWDSYDRHLAEARFRFGTVPPLVAIVLGMSIQPGGHIWWLAFLIVPAALAMYGLRSATEAASTLVQAIVLKMVEPPVLERLRTYIVQKKEAERKPGSFA